MSRTNRQERDAPSASRAYRKTGIATLQYLVLARRKSVAFRRIPTRFKDGFVLAIQTMEETWSKANDALLPSGIDCSPQQYPAYRVVRLVSF